MDDITLDVSNNISFNTILMFNQLKTATIYKLVPMFKVPVFKEIRQGILVEMERLTKKKLSDGAK